jgi:O-antigen/teichoic acid export membrane protein
MSTIPPITLSYIKEKWQHAGFQKYLQNTGWMFISRILCMGMAFITTAFIARKLGPLNFGQLSYATSFVSLFSVLASLGIDNILYRDIIKNQDKRKEYLGSAFSIKLLAGLLTTILVSISAFIWAEDDVSKTLILILSSTFVFNAFQIITFEFQAQVKSKYPSIIAFIITLIVNILKIIFIMNGKGVIYLAFILLLESILYAIFYCFFYEKKIGGKISEWKFNKNTAINLLKDSWPLIFTSAFVLVYARIDQIFIKHMLGAVSVGIYSAAVTLAEVWYFIPGIIIASIFPAIMNAKKTSEKMYHARLKKLSILLLILAVIIALPVTMLAPFIIKIVYGSAFIDGSIILQIYVWACVGTFLGYLTHYYLITENNKKGLVYMTLIPMIINIALNLLWIPKYGIVGSAYATLISYSCGPMTLLLFKKTRNDLKKIFYK